LFLTPLDTEELAIILSTRGYSRYPLNLGATIVKMVRKDCSDPYHYPHDDLFIWKGKTMALTRRSQESAVMWKCGIVVGQNWPGICDEEGIFWAPYTFPLFNKDKVGHCRPDQNEYPFTRCFINKGDAKRFTMWAFIMNHKQYLPSNDSTVKALFDVSLHSDTQPLKATSSGMSKKRGSPSDKKKQFNSSRRKRKVEPERTGDDIESFRVFYDASSKGNDPLPFAVTVHYKQRGTATFLVDGSGKRISNMFLSRPFIAARKSRISSLVMWVHMGIMGHEATPTGHCRRNGCSWNVQVRWADDSITFEPLNIFMQDDPDECFRYGREHHLLEATVWKGLVPARTKKQELAVAGCGEKPLIRVPDLRRKAKPLRVVKSRNGGTEKINSATAAKMKKSAQLRKRRKQKIDARKPPIPTLSKKGLRAMKQLDGTSINQVANEAVKKNATKVSRSRKVTKKNSVRMRKCHKAILDSDTNQSGGRTMAFRFYPISSTKEQKIVCTNSAIMTMEEPLAMSTAPMCPIQTTATDVVSEPLRGTPASGEVAASDQSIRPVIHNASVLNSKKQVKRCSKCRNKGCRKCREMKSMSEDVGRISIGSDPDEREKGVVFLGRESLAESQGSGEVVKFDESTRAVVPRLRAAKGTKLISRTERVKKCSKCRNKGCSKCREIDRETEQHKPPVSFLMKDGVMNVQEIAGSILRKKKPLPGAQLSRAMKQLSDTSVNLFANKMATLDAVEIDNMLLSQGNGGTDESTSVLANLSCWSKRSTTELDPPADFAPSSLEIAALHEACRSNHLISETRPKLVDCRDQYPVLDDGVALKFSIRDMTHVYVLWKSMWHKLNGPARVNLGLQPIPLRQEEWPSRVDNKFQQCVFNEDNVQYTDCVRFARGFEVNVSNDEEGYCCSCVSPCDPSTCHCWITDSAECPPHCRRGGGPCGNRRIASGNWFKLLQIFPTDQYEKKVVIRNRTTQRGVRSLSQIQQGDLVVEYCGIVKPAKYGRNPYVLEVKDCGSSPRYNHDIDASNVGNVARYINHSCDPNLELRIVVVEGVPRAFFFAQTSISIGDEVTFDYRWEAAKDIACSGAITFTKCNCGLNFPGYEMHRIQEPHVFPEMKHGNRVIIDPEYNDPSPYLEEEHNEPSVPSVWGISDRCFDTGPDDTIEDQPVMRNNDHGPAEKKKLALQQESCTPTTLWEDELASWSPYCAPGMLSDLDELSEISSVSTISIGPNEPPKTSLRGKRPIDDGENDKKPLVSDSTTQLGSCTDWGKEETRRSRVATDSSNSSKKVSYEDKTIVSKCTSTGLDPCCKRSRKEVSFAPKWTDAVVVMKQGSNCHSGSPNQEPAAQGEWKSKEVPDQLSISTQESLVCHDTSTQLIGDKMGSVGANTPWKWYTFNRGGKGCSRCDGKGCKNCAMGFPLLPWCIKRSKENCAVRNTCSLDSFLALFSILRDNTNGFYMRHRILHDPSSKLKQALDLIGQDQGDAARLLLYGSYASTILRGLVGKRLKSGSQEALASTPITWTCDKVIALCDEVDEMESSTEDEVAQICRDLKNPCTEINAWASVSDVHIALLEPCASASFANHGFRVRETTCCSTCLGGPISVTTKQKNYALNVFSQSTSLKGHSLFHYAVNDKFCTICKTNCRSGHVEVEEVCSSLFIITIKKEERACRPPIQLFTVLPDNIPIKNKLLRLRGVILGDGKHYISVAKMDDCYVVYDGQDKVQCRRYNLDIGEEKTSDIQQDKYIHYILYEAW